MSLLLLLGCFARPAPVVAPAPAPFAEQEPPVNFSPLETRASTLLADVQDADARERLQELRELMAAMRELPPPAQRKVFGYATRVLAIEERNRPQPLDFDGFGGVREVPVQEAPVLDAPSNAPSPAPDAPAEEPDPR
jgi:hypothetical protein